MVDVMAPTLLAVLPESSTFNVLEPQPPFTTRGPLIKSTMLPGCGAMLPTLTVRVWPPQTVVGPLVDWTFTVAAP